MNLKPIDTSRPHSARMYDYYLGGKDSYPIDEQAAKHVISLVPEIRTVARANRSFMHRASRLLATRGIHQFLDIGTGIPTEPNLHQVVQSVNRSARIVYVDHDPIVLRHAEALLRSTPEGQTRYVEADVLEPEAIIDAARETLDLEKPVALSLVALLHFVPDDKKPYEIVRKLLGALAPGSYLTLSHVTGDFNPQGWAKAVDIYRQSGVPAQVRSRDEFTDFFEGLILTEPGVETVTRWRPETDRGPDDDEIALYVGVARKS
ncbi:SAM-dependent methyltransferase [Streptomyces sp. NPDC093510]|uniref:SAM-dependent methyltransferase n=1 Tax=Streptomyces sp. NPDC093510 TaxID=3155199 RepID=UPI003422B472